MNSTDSSELTPADVPSHNGRSAGTPGRTTTTFLVVTAFLNTMGAGILSPVLPFIVR